MSAELKAVPGATPREERRGNPEYHDYLESQRWRTLAKAVKLRAEILLHRSDEGFQRRRGLRISDEDQLGGLTPTFHNDLNAAQVSEMGSVGIGRDPRAANMLLECAADAIDEGMVNTALGNVRDPVAALLEDSDLWRVRATAHREANTMPVAHGRAAVELRSLGACVFAERREPPICRLRRSGVAIARTARAGRPMRAGLRLAANSRVI